MIAALMEKGSIKAAADYLGCKVETIYARKKTKEFEILYREAKDEIIKAITAKLQKEFDKSIDTLTMLRDDSQTPRPTRVNCAVNLMQYGTRYIEVRDIVERLEALEQRQQEENERVDY